MLRAILLSVLLLPCLLNASVNVVVNGTTYTIPQKNEKGWGDNVTSWIQAMSANTLQPSGGTFSLTADADFGSNFGLKSLYYKSRSANVASSGMFRLGVGDTFGFRNNANTGNLLFSVDGTDNLLFNGSRVALGSLGATNQLFGTNAAGTAFEAKAATVTAAGSLTIPNGQTVTLPSGTVGAPSLAYSADAATGPYLLGVGDYGLAVGGILGIETLKLGSNVNFGLGQAASPTTGYPMSASYTYNGPANWNFSNLSSGTSSSTVFYIGNGPGGGNGITVENQAYNTGSYAGGGLLRATSSLSQLNIASENAGGSIRFNVGGTAALANEAMRLSTTSLTLNKGWGILNISGSTSGVITLQPQAVAGTYNWNYPTTAGGSGQVLTSGGGAAAPMTWTSVLVNPATAAYDMLYQNAGNTALTNLANGSTGQVLTATTAGAPSWSNPSAGSVVSATSAVKTPTASGAFHSLSGNSVTLTAGRWMLYGSINFDNGGTSPTYTQVGTQWAAATGADTATPPAALSTVTNLTVLSAIRATGAQTYYQGTTTADSQYITAVNAMVSCSSSCVVFLNAFSTQTTSANARITAFLSATRFTSVP